MEIAKEDEHEEREPTHHAHVEALVALIALGYLHGRRCPSARRHEGGMRRRLSTFLPLTTKSANPEAARLP
jgi:hypothetical protein